MLKKWCKDIKYLESNFTLSQLQQHHQKLLVTKDNRLSFHAEKSIIMREDRCYKMILEKENEQVSTNDTLDLTSKDQETNL